MDWRSHEQRLAIMKDGVRCELGLPFTGLVVKMVSLNHGKVKRAIRHSESIARRKEGLRGPTATPDAPNTNEVDEAVSLAAVLAGTRSVEGAVSFGPDDEWAFEFDEGAKYLKDDDHAIWRGMLEDSTELVNRCAGVMRDLGRRSDGEIIELHRSGGVFGRDLVANLDD